MNSSNSMLSETRRLIFSIAVAAGMAVVSGCTGSTPPVSSAAFEQWFVGAAAGVPEAFDHLTPGMVDSLRGAVRSSSISGAGTVLLADTAGRSYTVGFRTPESFRRDTLYPLIVYLHGGTGSALTNKGERAWDIYSFIADTIPVFLASPSANREVPWWSPAGLSRILQTVRYMTLHYPIDPGRIFCAGVSDGATGCYAVANFVAAPFAGFIAVSGFGGMLAQLGVELHPENIMQHPLYNINAGNDRLYPPAAVNRFLDDMENAGVGIIRKFYASEEHGFEYRLQERQAICTFIEQWRRPDPAGMNWSFDASYPFAVPHVLAIGAKEGVRHFSLVAGCRNDTIKVNASGVESVIMYFSNDGTCRPKYCMNGNGGAKCHGPVRAPRRYDLQVMKAGGIPILTIMTYFSLNM